MTLWWVGAWPSAAFPCCCCVLKPHSGSPAGSEHAAQGWAKDAQQSGAGRTHSVSHSRYRPSFRVPLNYSLKQSAFWFFQWSSRSAVTFDPDGVHSPFEKFASFVGFSTPSVKLQTQKMRLHFCREAAGKTSCGRRETFICSLKLGAKAATWRPPVFQQPANEPRW